MITINEIKKVFYKENPQAELLYILKGSAFYQSQIVIEEKPVKIHFTVPVSDMGDAKFYLNMDSKHMIRWISEISAS